VPHADLALDFGVLAICGDELVLFEEEGVLAGGFATGAGNLFACLELAVASERFHEYRQNHIPYYQLQYHRTFQHKMHTWCVHMG
jgi:hypothetical protein